MAQDVFLNEPFVIGFKSFAIVTISTGFKALAAWVQRKTAQLAEMFS